MKNSKKNKYYFMEPMIKDIVFIDGIARSGKLLTGSLVSSFKKMESFELGENFNHFIPALKMNKCSYDFAKSYLCNYINQLIYDKMLSRHVNFRSSDRTGIQNYFNPNLYKKRLKMTEGDQVLKRIKSLKQILPFVTHDIMVNYNAFDKLNIKVKFISVYRSPIELVYSWIKRNIVTRWGKDTRIFTLLINTEDTPCPTYLRNLPKIWKKLNKYERCVYYVILLITKSIKEQRKIKNKKDCFVTTYDRIVEDTFGELKKISKFLKTDFSKKTHLFIRREKCPNKYLKKKINSKIDFIKKNVDKKIYERLFTLEKKYKKDLYGLNKIC